MLEQLVHAGVGKLPKNRVVSRIELPGVGIEEFVLDDESIWEDESITRSIGRHWLEGAETLALIVPSAVASPYGRNVLINPVHPNFKHVKVIDQSPVRWDPRLR